MFEESQLLKFTPFVFKNGREPKPKYFAVLKHMGETLMMASLPTSQNHVPDSMAVEALDLGKLEPTLMQELIDCLKNSSTIKKRYKKILSA